MASNELNVCKFCKSVISKDRIYSRTAICGTCGQLNQRSGEFTFKMEWVFVAIGALFLVAVGVRFSDKFSVRFTSASAYAGMSYAELEKAKQKCLKAGDEECLVDVYQQLTQLDPLDWKAKANWAINLTRTKRFAEANPIYKEIMTSGHSTFDLMGFYGMNLEALGEKQEAIKWYEKTLALEASLVDITERLAALYIQDNRTTEAVSLLQSYIYKVPTASGRLTGDLVAGLESYEQSASTESVRLVGFSKSHFGLPLSLGPNKKAEMFMVDKESKLTTLPTGDIEQYWPELKSKARSSTIVLEKGERVQIHRVRIPKLVVGGWEFANIEVAYCDSCTRVAGMSLLKNVKISTEAKGLLSTMTLTR